MVAETVRGKERKRKRKRMGIQRVTWCDVTMWCDVMMWYNILLMSVFSPYNERKVVMKRGKAMIRKSEIK